MPRLAACAAVACAIGVTAAPPANGGVTPELADALRLASPVERIPVIAHLADRVDPSPGDAPADIIRALRRQALTGQSGLLARVGLTDVRPFWLINAVSLRATPLQVRLIAADPAVASVGVDPPVGLADGPARTARALQAGPGGWGLDAVRARRAWSALGTTGAGVRVGIIDSGIDAGHPALAGKVAGWRDVVAGGPEPYDDNGHGTHAAGVLAGGDGSRSLVGVAPGARLLVAKAISGDGTGLGSDMVAAAEWLADPDGDPATADSPQVISNSWAQMADSNDPWFRPLVRRWRSLGIVAVFAAGNKGPQAGTLGSPAGYPEALAVGAVGADRSVAGFSSRGPVAWQNPDGLGPAPGPIPKPDLAAPGVDIVSSVPGGGYRAASGTSMAAPHVAGVAALVRAANPSLTAPAAERILLSTAADLGAPGRDNLAGEGLVDALAATARATAGSRRAGPRRTLGRAPRRATVRLTLAQLRINHRISVAATARVGLLEVRLGMSASPSLLPAAARRPVLRLSAAQMKITQRIAQSALRHASAVERHVASSPPAPAATAAAPSVAAVGRVTLTARQLLVNQRIAQAALRRVARAERLARSSGMLPPGPAP